MARQQHASHYDGLQVVTFDDLLSGSTSERSGSMRHSTYQLSIAWILLLASAANAATTGTSPWKPPVDQHDIANLKSPTNTVLLFNDRPVQGQAFRTDAGADTYLLKSLTVQLRETNDGIIESNTEFRVRVNRIEDGQSPVASPMIDVLTSSTADAKTGEFFTIMLDEPIELQPDTLYGFDIGVSGSNHSWTAGMPAINLTADAYAGGRHYQGPKVNDFEPGDATEIKWSPGKRDLVFALDITPAPEPLSIIFCCIGAVLAISHRSR